MLELAASENGSVEAPNRGRSRSSRPKAALPNPPRKSRIKALAALNPRDSVRIQALPGVAQREGKVLARSSEPPREQVFWENYHRRQKQFTQGYFTPTGKPYQELGEIVYTDPKKLTLYSLGQLAQEPVKNNVQEKTPKEVAEVTTKKYSSGPKSDPPEPVKRLSPFREKGKELKTLSKAVAHSRPHINSVKQGRAYFHTLHQESQERKNTLKADQRAEGTRTAFQPRKYSCDLEEPKEEINTCSTDGNHLRESGKKQKMMTLRSFTPVHTSVLIPSLPGAKSKRLFQQLCAIHWLLEALTLKPNRSMPSILTCWNPLDPGGSKKTVKETEDDKLATYMWEVLITNTKKRIWKARFSPLSKKMNKKSTRGISHLSSQSSPCRQSPYGSAISTVLCSEDNVKINVASSDVMSEPAQAEEPSSLSPFLQQVIQRMREEMTKGARQQDTVKKTGLQRLTVAQKNYRVGMPSIKDKENMISTKQRPRRERRPEEQYYQQYQSLKQLRYSRRDIERLRQLYMRYKTEPEEDELNWFRVLLARLPESVKSDHYVQKILKKLEKYGKTPGLEIHPDTFLKVLGNLQVWELCSPEIAAAVEFVRESIVQMPEEDFSAWFQTRVASLSAQPSTV